MSSRERSLQQIIDEVAGDSGVGQEDEFIVDVKAMFAQKGIALSEDSAPYVQAIRDAFLLHAQMRKTEAVAKQRLERLDAALKRLTAGWQHLEEELAKMHTALVAQERALQRKPAKEERESAFQWPMWPSRVLN